MLGLLRGKTLGVPQVLGPRFLSFFTLADPPGVLAAVGEARMDGLAIAEGLADERALDGPSLGVLRATAFSSTS